MLEDFFPASCSVKINSAFKDDAVFSYDFNCCMYNLFCKRPAEPGVLT